MQHVSTVKLLVLSHPCVTPVNQRLFAAIEDRIGGSVAIVGPANWIDDYGTVRGLERDPSFDGILHSIPVWLSGNVPLHTYRTFFTALLRKMQPDVIFAHHEPYAVATAQLYLANTLTLQRPIGFFTWQNIQKTYPIPFRWMERWVYRTSSFAFPGSRSAETVLRNKGYGGPTTLLPGSIDPDLYQPFPADQTPRSELCQGPEELLIGYAGRLTEDKGLVTLIQATAQLPDDVSWRLVLVGTGEDELRLRRLAHDLSLADRVTFTGYVPHEDMPRYLSAFDVLVLPSETQPNWKEQFGRVLIESLACETPVVGSSSGEIPHVIEKSQGGVTFPEGAPSSLADQLTHLLRNSSLRHELAVRGRQRVCSMYTTDALAERFVDTLEASCSSCTPPSWTA